MKMTRLFPSLLCLFILSPVYAAQGIVVLNATSKELKRSAHRMRIPVDQLKHARQALQEATDLAQKMQPRPTEQFFNLAQSWMQLDKSTSQKMIEEFIEDLRSEAAECPDVSCYQRVTSAGMLMIQTMQDFDYEKVNQLIRGWPAPRESAGDAAKSYKESMEAQVKHQALMRLASLDPEKALSVLPPIEDATSTDYFGSAQIAQGLMNNGKKDESLRLVDKILQGFDPNTSSPEIISGFENFVHTVAVNLDSTRATTAALDLVTAMMKQNSPEVCNTALKSADSEVDLTCPESKILNFVRSFPMRPVLTQKVLDSVPGLKSKLDMMGGIDNLNAYGWGGPFVSIVHNSAPNRGSSGVSQAMAIGAYTNSQDISKLILDLKGKGESYAKSRLRGMDADFLLNIAMSSAYQDPDIEAAALELAQQLLPQVEPLQKRATMLQRMVHAYRQVDGEVDSSLLKSGFIVADDLRQETEKRGVQEQVNQSIPARMTQADQLEAFLVAELSRNSFDAAIGYVRSLEKSPLKLSCLMEIVRALSQQNF